MYHCLKLYGCNKTKGVEKSNKLYAAPPPPPPRALKKKKKSLFGIKFMVVLISVQALFQISFYSIWQFFLSDIFSTNMKGWDDASECSFISLFKMFI